MENDKIYVVVRGNCRGEDFGSESIFSREDIIKYFNTFKELNYDAEAFDDYIRQSRVIDCYDLENFMHLFYNWDTEEVVDVNFYIKREDFVNSHEESTMGVSFTSANDAKLVMFDTMNECW